MNSSINSLHCFVAYLCLWFVILEWPGVLHISLTSRCSWICRDSSTTPSETPFFSPFTFLRHQAQLAKASHLPGRALSLAYLEVLLRMADYASFQADAAANQLGWLYGIPYRYTAQAVQLAEQLDHDQRLFVGEPGFGSLTITALIDNLDTSGFDSSNLLPLGAQGGLYLAQSQTPTGQLPVVYAGCIIWQKI